MTTNATTEQIKKLFPHATGLGQAFGIMTIPSTHGIKEPPGPFESQVAAPKSAPIELASLRSDGPYPDGRHPEYVRPGTVEQDAQRRDFTINALFFNLHTQQLIDPCQAQQDLQKKRIQSMGPAETRFKEDHLRCLRCLRFAVQLGFNIEASTWQALLTHLQHHPTRPQTLSAERIKKEVKLMLSSPKPVKALLWLHETKLMHWLLPTNAPVQDLALSRAEKTKLEWFLSGTEKVLCYIQAPVGKSRLLNRAQCSRSIGKLCRETLTSDECREFEVLKLLVHPWGGEFLNYFELGLDFLSCIKVEKRASALLVDFDCFVPSDELLQRARKTLTNLKARHKSLSQSDTRPWLTGSDLIRLGFKPGPEFSQHLDYAYALQLLKLAPKEQIISGSIFTN